MASVLQCGVQVSVMLLSLVALAWIGAWWAGIPFRLGRVPDFAALALATLPLGPLLLWLHFRGRARPESRGSTLLLLVAMIVVLALMAGILPFSRGWLLSAVGLLAIAVTFFVALFLYRRAVFNFYDRGDLVQRGGSRRTVSIA
jgi:hypothetical protein